MEQMKGYRPADWGESPSTVLNAAGKGLYKPVELNWSSPQLLPKNGAVPRFPSNDPILYLLIRDHGKQMRTDNIRYVGLTTQPRTRFDEHGTIRRLCALRGSVHFSSAVVNIKGRNRELRTQKALEEIEHILIWALWAYDHRLDNDKKQNTLPGLGQNGGSAWQIKNVGHRFSGRMPLEIIYPWMLLKVGRDRSAQK